MPYMFLFIMEYFWYKFSITIEIGATQQTNMRSDRIFEHSPIKKYNLTIPNINIKSCVKLFVIKFWEVAYILGKYFLRTFWEKLRFF